MNHAFCLYQLRQRLSDRGIDPGALARADAPTVLGPYVRCGDCGQVCVPPEDIDTLIAQAEDLDALLAGLPTYFEGHALPLGLR